MIDEQIIELAHKAGIGDKDHDWPFPFSAFKHFVNLILEKEQKEIIKLVDSCGYISIDQIIARSIK